MRFFNRAVWPHARPWVYATVALLACVITYNISYNIVDKNNLVITDIKSKCTTRECNVRMALMAYAAMIIGPVYLIAMIVMGLVCCYHVTKDELEDGKPFWDTFGGGALAAVIILICMGAICAIGGYTRLFHADRAISGAITLVVLIGGMIALAVLACLWQYCISVHNDIKEQYLQEIVVEQAKEN